MSKAKELTAILGKIAASLTSGGIASGLGYIDNLLKSAFKSATQFHQEGIAFSRQLGLNAREAQVYTEVLTKRTEKLAATYGVTAKEIIEIQKNISEATNRQLMLNDAQAEYFLQLNKLVGSGTVSKFTEEITSMGGQLDTVAGAVSKAYATAAKSGLNAQKVSEKIASNLNLANKLSFRNGVDGLTRMAMQAEKMGMSLNSVSTAADRFMELDKAITNSAQMQMLGGSAAVNFGNPLTAAFEANYDPEAFAERMQNSLASYAEFDATKGIAYVNGMNKDFIKAISEAMGISQEEAQKMAKKQAEVRYKERNVNFGALRTSDGKSLTQEQIDFLINKSQVKNGRTIFTTTDKETIDLTGGQTLNSKVLKEMMKYEGMSDHDIMAENAKSLTSINEQLSGIGAAISAMFAGFLTPFFPKLRGDIQDIGAWAKNELQPAAENVGVAVKEILDWFRTNKEPIRKVGSALFGFIRFATEHWKLTLGAILGLKALSFLGGGSAVNGAHLVWGGAKSAAKIGKSAMSPLLKEGKLAANAFKNIFKLERSGGSGLFKSISEGFKGLGQIGKGGYLKNFAKLGKFAKIGGSIASVASLGFSSYSFNDIKSQISELDKKFESGAVGKKEYEAKRKELVNQKNEALGSGSGVILGGAIGSLIGPEGTIIGAMIGDFLGGFIGKAWNGISNSIADFWNGTVRDIADKTFGRVGTAAVDAISKVNSLFLDFCGGILENIVGGIGDMVEGVWNGIKTQFNGFLDGFAMIFGGDISGGIKTILKSQLEGTFTAIKGTVIGFFKTALAPVLSAIDVIKTIYNDLKAPIEILKNGVTKLFKSPVETVTNFIKGHAEGGIIGGNSYSGDRVLARLNSGEMVMNTSQQNALFGFIKSLPQATEIVAKPVGEKEYIYTPKGTETYKVGNSTIKVSDFNINLSGTIKLDGGNFMKNIDANALLNDAAFISSLKDMIKQSINHDMNGGRFSNDLAYRRGGSQSLSIIGR